MGPAAAEEEDEEGDAVREVDPPIGLPVEEVDIALLAGPLPAGEGRVAGEERPQDAHAVRHVQAAVEVAVTGKRPRGWDRERAIAVPGQQRDDVGEVGDGEILAAVAVEVAGSEGDG